MEKSIDLNYQNLLSSLKEKIQKAKVKAVLTINAQLLAIYWEIGKTIVEQQQMEGWGTKIIDRLAIDLKIEFPDQTGFSIRNLKYMKAFAEEYPNFLIVDSHNEQTAVKGNRKNDHEIVQVPLAQLEKNQTDSIVQGQLAQLTWYHHITLIDKVKNIEERLYYIQKTIENGWSRTMMVTQINNNLYHRQGKVINNFTTTMLSYDSELAKETFKSPYIFDFLTLEEGIKEKEVERGLVQHLKKFMLELGRGFAYVGNQYNLQVEDDDYFLDLLFYNVKLHCYVVFELKVGDFKPEYAGKLNFYINTVDEKIKEKDDKATIGILLCKTPNDTVVKYSLKGLKTPLGVAEYEFAKILPKQLQTELPTIEELELELDKEYEELKTPAQKKFDVLKEKIANIKTDKELEKVATLLGLEDLLEKDIRPLFAMLLKRLNQFDDYFYKNEYSWQGLLTCINNIDAFAQDWKGRDFTNIYDISHFQYRLNGFKKGGVESFDVVFQLTFHVFSYWYGFSINGKDNNQPFIKKMYHERLNEEEKQEICDVAMNAITDEIEHRVSNIQGEK